VRGPSGGARGGDTGESAFLSSFDTCSHANQDNFHNIFDNISALALPKDTSVADEVTLYLSTGPEPIKDVLAWWYEKCTVYPLLSRMALDYLSIPGE
jgi:hypothetical protein